MAVMKVSVIIPTYNRGRYISDCIDSVLNQTFYDLEVIVVDDGSTDDTKKIVQKIDDDRVTYIATANSGRPAVPRNIGLSRARGEYISFLDSDDLWVPWKLEEQILLMEEKKEIDVSYGNVIPFDEAGEKDVVLKWPFFKNGTPKYRLLLGNFVTSITVVMRSRFLTEHNLRFNEKLLWVEDYDLWLRSAMCGAKFYYSNKVFAKHRLHEMMITKTSIELGSAHRCQSRFACGVFL